MRKTLLAATALLGVSFGMAQAADLSIASTTPAGLTGYVSPVVAATPGHIVVHLGFRQNVYFEGMWNGNNGSAVGGGLASTQPGGNKTQPQALTGYSRIFGGFDGETTQGLKYGAVMEIRENNFAGPTYGSGSAVFSSSFSSAESFSNTLFVRRGYIYIGTDQIGMLRAGEVDGPMSLFLAGTFDNLGTGGWNGDLVAYSSTYPIWAWADVGNSYTTAKLEYLSPELYGFQFAISYEPNAAPLQDNYFQCSTGNCFDTSTSTTPSELTRRRNTIEVGLRYIGTLFNTVDVNTSLTGEFAGRVLGAAGTSLLGVTKYQDQRVGDFGIKLTYAGITVGGNIQGGSVNGQWANLPSGGHDQLAYQVGVSYEIGGLLAGASYFSNYYQGMPGLHARRDQGVTVAANWTFAPGAQAIVEYDYGWRHQSGFDFFNGSPGTANNDVKEQIIGAGFQFAF
ncbi:MAG: hypothetical protein ACP5NP_15245 [Acetobacteraceae bacterium]